MKPIILIVSAILCAGMSYAQKSIQINTQEELLAAIQTMNASPDNDYSLFIYPGVYWLDDPDDPTERTSNGGTPFAQTIHCRNIRIIGTDPDATKTVLAVNRGQTHGAIGNFTMFLFRCRNIYTENITYGNYCNVDLDYPGNPSLSRKKRAEAIVQAQLAICAGTDSVIAKNCSFISRLNLCNFSGARNAVFDNCHLECTDDALTEGLYHHCHLTFYSSKPFYSTSRGATFDDCDIDIMTQGTQYFTKAPGPIHLRNVRFHCDHKIQLAWCKENHPELCTAENITLNGKPVQIDNTPYTPIPQVHERVDRRKVEGGYVYEFDAYKPIDTSKYSWQPDPSREAWYWGTAPDGAEGHQGLVQAQRGARIRITPESAKSNNITSARLTIAPCKSAGQGFGSATGQYMDICVAMDNQHLTGYGLRLERTPDYDHAVVASIVQYENGETKALTKGEKCELFLTECKIRVMISSGVLTAVIQHGKKKQTLSCRIIANRIGNGFMLQHTGTVGTGASILKEIEVR